jgi:diacylglycerol O-acyltransferase
VRIGVAIFSYRDRLTFGLTGDYEAAADLQVLVDGTTYALDELVREARVTV